jgi:hypothetical protein
MKQQFLCTHIQYHMLWTKFYFSSVLDGTCLNISITEKRCQRFKERGIYDFVLPIGEQLEVLGLTSNLKLSNG